MPEVLWTVLLLLEKAAKTGLSLGFADEFSGILVCSFRVPCVAGKREDEGDTADRLWRSPPRRTPPA